MRKNLSDFWRYDRSPDRVLELTSVLQGADILIGNMGSNLRVTWSGGEISYTDFQKRLVALDYGPLKEQKCPFPGTAVDEVIGYAAHEGGHCLWSRPGKDKAIPREIEVRWNNLPLALQKDWQADPETTLSELCRLQNILEDAYIDHQVAQRWPVLGEYIRIARNKLAEQTPLDLTAIALSASPDRNAILNLWVAVSLGHQPLPPAMSTPVKQVMEALLALSRKAIEEPTAEIRHSLAVEAAIVLWREFPIRETPLPTLPQSLEPGSAPEGGQAPQKETRDSTPQADSLPNQMRNLDDFDPSSGHRQRGREVTPVPSKLLEQVTKAMAGEEEELSASVAQALAEDPRRVAARAKRADYDPERARQVISQVQREVREIQEAFRHQQDRNSRWLYGRNRGKLDERCLWKPFVGDPGYYKRKDVMDRPSLAVGLLLDMSGSMSRHQAIVEQTAAVFAEGLRQMPEVNFAAWGYTGKGPKVSLTRLCDRQLPGLCLANVDKGGNTPSGAAIAGAKMLLAKMPQKKKLLLHFTDGRPDSAPHVLKVVQACHEEAIRVHAIGLPQHEPMLARQYGRANFEIIQSVAELPKAVARIVKRLGTAVAGNQLMPAHLGG